jgi:AraC-like DNA-binding protein
MSIGLQGAWRLERNDRRRVFVAADALTAYAETVPTHADVHACPAWKVVLTLAPSGLADLHQPGRPTRWAPGAVVPPEVVHGGGVPSGFAVVYLDPWRVSRPASAGPMLLDAPTVARVAAALGLDADLGGVGPPAGRAGPGEAAGVDVGEGRRALAAVLGPAPAIDPRVAHALAGLADADRLETVAAEVGLSGPRLRQLVRRDVGIPLGRLRQWARLRAAVATLDVSSVAAAAHAGGFADQAHLTRTARRMVGRTPATLGRLGGPAADGSAPAAPAA